MSGNEPAGDNSALEQLMLGRQWASALPIAAALMDQGSIDGRRWFGICQWQLEEFAGAAHAFRECFTLGDGSVSIYLIALACDQGAIVEPRNPQLDWARQHIGTAHDEEICQRVAGALELIAKADAVAAFTALMLPVLELGCSRGSEQCLSLLLELLDGDIRAWAEDENTSPDVLNAITLRRNGMSAWTACTNPSLSTSTASRVIAGDRESLIRAISENSGLESSTREQATQRLAELEQGASDSLAQSASTSTSNAPPISEHGLEAGNDPKDRIWQLLRDDRLADAHALALELAGGLDEETTVVLALVEIAWQEQFSRPDFNEAQRLLDSVPTPAKTYVGLVAPLHSALLAIRCGQAPRIAIIKGLRPHLEQVVTWPDVDSGPLVYALQHLVGGLAEASSMGTWLWQWEEELAHLTCEAIDSIPSFAGDAAVEKGDFEDAERHFRLAMSTSPTRLAEHAANSLAFSVLIPMERWDDAEEVLIPLAGSANPGDSMNARSNLAQVAYLRGERDRAHRLFTRVNTSGMDFLFAESSYFLAQIALVKGDNTSAQSMFTAAASTEDKRYAEMARVALAESFAIVEGDQSVGEAEETERNRAPEIDKGLLKRAEDGDILAWNDLGHCLIEAGQREEGLTWLERSARAGVPWALSNYNWQLLLEGEHERAVALFDEVEAACESLVRKYVGNSDFGKFAPQQLANARSNDALNRLALGGPSDLALRVWSLGGARGHEESTFYPAIVALREGRDTDAAAITSRLTATMHRSVLHDMESSVQECQGWFSEWCRDGIRLLTSQTISEGPLANVAKFCGACGTARTPGGNFCVHCGQAF